MILCLTYYQKNIAISLWKLQEIGAATPTSLQDNNGCRQLWGTYSEVIIAVWGNETTSCDSINQ